MFSKDADTKLIGYCDSDWGGCWKDKQASAAKLTTRYIFTIQGGVISSKSKRQMTVALSSAEAEYMAIAEAC
jgi:hypothetical protein